MMRAETSVNMLPANQLIFERKKEMHEKGWNVDGDICTMIDDNSNASMCDLHDGEVLHLMTQH